MQKLLIASVLGFGLAACSSVPVQRIEVSAKPIEKPKLVLPRADQLNQQPVSWVLITPANAEEVFEKLTKEGRPLVLFGLTDKGYERLALNLSDLRAYLQQQQTIIAAYKVYYEKSQEALDDANEELDRVEDEANKEAPKPEKKAWEIWK